MHVKATRFRRTCDCIAQQSDLQEREKSRFMQISIDSTSAKNVVVLSCLASALAIREFPQRFLIHIYDKEPSQRIATENEQLANAYSKELGFSTVLSSHKLSNN